MSFLTHTGYILHVYFNQTRSQQAFVVTIIRGYGTAELAGHLVLRLDSAAADF